MTPAQLIIAWEEGSVDEVCPDSDDHICSSMPLCPCDFTEKEAAEKLSELGFRVETRRRPEVEDTALDAENRYPQGYR